MADNQHEIRNLNFKFKLLSDYNLQQWFKKPWRKENEEKSVTTKYYSLAFGITYTVNRYTNTWLLCLLFRITQWASTVNSVCLDTIDLMMFHKMQQMHAGVSIFLLLILTLSLWNGEQMFFATDAMKVFWNTASCSEVINIKIIMISMGIPVSFFRLLHD